MSEVTPETRAGAAAWLTRNLWLLGLTSFFFDVSSEMVYPLLPFYLTVTLGSRPAVLGVVEGVAESVAAGTGLVMSWWSDRMRRRKPFAVGGYGLTAIGKALLPFARTWPMVMASRVIDRVGKGIRSSPRDALIAESVNPAYRGRAFGFHRAMDTAGAVVGIIAAYGVLRASGEIRWVLWVSAVVAAVGLLAVLAVREARPQPIDAVARRARRPGFVETWRVLPLRLRLFLVVTLVFMLGNSSNQFLILRAGYSGFGERGAILLYLVMNVVYAAASYPAGALADRVGAGRLLVAGFGLYSFTYAGFALTEQSWAMWPLFGLYGLYTALTDGVAKAFVAELAPASVKATALALPGVVSAAALLPASVAAGWLWDHVSPSAALLVGSGAGLLAAVGMIFVLGMPAAAGVQQANGA